MDTRIERKSRFKKKHIYSLIGIAVGLLCLLWLLFRDTSSSLKVEKERITIATVQTVIVPRGSFYQASGGEYMYVVDEEEKTARRRPVRIGRQNPQYYEVVEGLQPGEKVIISGYDLFGENERLILR